jgi:hypothetical protein
MTNQLGNTIEVLESKRLRKVINKTQREGRAREEPSQKKIKKFRKVTT